MFEDPGRSYRKYCEDKLAKLREQKAELLIKEAKQARKKRLLDFLQTKTYGCMVTACPPRPYLRQGAKQAGYLVMHHLGAPVTS